MLESAQQIKKINSDNYVFDHQWFRVTNIRVTNFMISPTKTPPDNPIIDYQPKKKRKEKKRNKKSKHFCKHLLGILVGFPSVA